MVMEGLHEDMGGGGGESNGIQCMNHPYKNSKNPGGICAFCLQEKLGKLVSSSFPIAIFPSSSSSSTTPSFRSDYGVVVNNTTSSSSSSTNITVLPNLNNNNNNNNGGFHSNNARRTKTPFLLIQRKKKNKKEANMNMNMAAVSGSEQNGVVFKRSKSTTTPRRNVHFMDEDNDSSDLVFSPRRRGFWSFIYQSKHPPSTRKAFREIGYGGGGSRNTTSSKMGGSGNNNNSNNNNNGSMSERSRRDEKNDESPNQGSSMDRKVSRSRSVGCGSRSFSGDLFERISTGLGDCTLRRVESQREGKPKASHDSIKERVKCGGIFGGFMMTSSSSSSSSSSYWVSSSAEDNHHHNNNNNAGSGGKMVAAPPPGTVAHGRSKSWGWAFASPIRAFGKPSSTSGKRETGSNKNSATPNLSAIPSLLAVRT